MGEDKQAPGSREWLTWAVWCIPVIVAIGLATLILLDSGGSSEVSPNDAVSTNPARSASSEELGETTPPTTSFAQRVPTLPAEPYDYAPNLPDHFLAAAIPGDDEVAVVDLDSGPPDNPVTDAGATLGRVLFYDVTLSRNGTVRCASCHVQANSFTDPLVFSQGVDGLRTRRNSMPLANAAFNGSGRYLWDEKAPTLEAQVLMPFVDRSEMDLPLEAVVERIEARSFYEPLFLDAFGDDQVTPERVSAALAQFIRSMVSANSRYDDGRSQVASPIEPFLNFTDEENRGKELFFTPVAEGGGSCSSCHITEAQLTSVDGLDNNGLDDSDSELSSTDLGAFEISGDLSQLGSFRVPSLRNVEVTAPYMHDGRLTTLTDVIDHYNEGIQPHENLSPELIDEDGAPVRLGLSEQEVQALVAFLRTLTDREFLTDERFSEPFRSSS